MWLIFAVISLFAYTLSDLPGLRYVGVSVADSVGGTSGIAFRLIG